MFYEVNLTKISESAELVENIPFVGTCRGHALKSGGGMLVVCRGGNSTHPEPLTKPGVLLQ